MKKLRVAIYARVSHEEEVQSLNEQVEISKALTESYCKRNNLNYEIVKILIEEAGTSGSSHNRPEFDELISSIRNNEIDAVASKESSRLGRDIGISNNFKELVKAYNVTLIIPGLEYGINSSTGELMYDFMSVLSSAEKNRIIERTKLSIESLARTKKIVHGHTLPLGFRWKSKGIPIPIPSEIKEVNFIFDTFLRAGTIKDTLELLKEFGIKTRSGKNCRREYIERIIRNKKYISQYKIPCSKKEEYIILDYPVQVPVEKFKEANELLLSITKEFSKTTRKKSRVNLLSGLLFTKNGNALKGTSGKGKFYYRNMKEDLTYNAYEIEKGIIEFLLKIKEHKQIKGFLASKTAKEQIQQSPTENQKKRLVNKINELKKREELAKHKLLHEKLTGSLIKLLDDEVVKINDKRQAIKKEFEEINKIYIERQRAQQETEITIRNLYQAVPKVLNSGKPEVIRGVFRQLIKRITIDPASRTFQITWRISASNESVTVSKFNLSPINQQSEAAKNKLLGKPGTPIHKSPLYDLYINKGFSSIKSAEKLGVQKSTVLKYLKNTGIPRRKVGTNKKRKRGVAYGNKFLPNGRELAVMSEIKRKDIMRKMRQSKVTYQGIADHFNDLEIPTKSGKGKWDRGTICRILSSPSTP